MPATGADDRVVQVRLLHFNLAFGDGDLLARILDPRFRRIHDRPRVVNLRLADDPLLQQGLAAIQVELGLRQLRLVFSHALLRRCELRFGEREGCAGLRIVEVGEDLPGFDGVPFLDQDVDDFAGELRRHGRLAPCDDVARRVENGARGELPPVLTLADATFTDAAWRLADQYHAAPATARTTMTAALMRPIRLPPPPRSSRSMRSAARSLEISVIADVYAG
jgi:hypothetical protein